MQMVTYGRNRNEMRSTISPWRRLALDHLHESIPELLFIPMNPVPQPAMEKDNPAPEWFQRAIASPFEDCFVTVDGCRIHYLRWGRLGKPGLLLVHGGFAHAHWWDFIAPFFAEDYRVAALDLSGMGDSGRREKYTAQNFANEVISVCGDAGFGEPPVLVGHSFGGFVVLKAAALSQKPLGGVVIVDFPIRPPPLQKEHEAKRPLVRRKETYSNLEVALSRFRLIPAQPCDNQFILNHIARHSLARLDAGWNWKFDDHLFDDFELGNIPETLTQAKHPLAVIYGENSALFSPEIISYMSGLLGPNVPFVTMKSAHHHLFLEQPLEFVALIKNLLVQWKRLAGPN